MKNQRVPLRAELWLAILMFSALPPWVAVAETASPLDEQLIRAPKSGDLALVKELLKRGADVNAKDGYGRTALMVAADIGWLEAERLLLDAGADVNAKNNRGWTALMSAVYAGRLEVVELILERGADVNARTLDEGTALMVAAARDSQLRAAWYYELWDEMRRIYRYGFMGPAHPLGTEDPQIVKTLLAKGADVNAKDKIGWTALKRARSRGATEIVDLLKAHGAKE